MPDPVYKLAVWRGQHYRRRWLARLPELPPLQFASPPPPLDLRVFSYCSRHHLPEFTACAASFLKHAGAPREWTVLSDGTLGEDDFDFLHALHPCLRGIRPVELPLAALPAPLQPFLRGAPFGLKLALLMTMPVADGPCLYTDSDVLFFPAARLLLPPLLDEALAPPAHFLPDTRPAFDPRLLLSPDEASAPANAGFLLARRVLDWSPAAERWESLGPDAEATFFSEQTLCHLALRANGAAPLDPVRWILDLGDQTAWADRSAARAVAMRHYVAPVRHHFWNTAVRLLRDLLRPS